jgi:hypothetical protein
MHCPESSPFSRIRRARSCCECLHACTRNTFRAHQLPLQHHLWIRGVICMCAWAATFFYLISKVPKLHLSVMILCATPGLSGVRAGRRVHLGTRRSGRPVGCPCRKNGSFCVASDISMACTLRARITKIVSSSVVARFDPGHLRSPAPKGMLPGSLFKVTCV